jgi:hypothetical protein
MKGRPIIFVLLMAATAAWAQSPQILRSTREKLQSAQKTWNAQQSVVDTSDSTPGPPVARETVANTPSSPASAMLAKPSAKNVAKAKGHTKQALASDKSVPDAKKLLPKYAAGTAAGEERLTADAKRDAEKRDPFLSPLVARISGPNASCSGGKRCLAVDSISLRGVVKSQDGMIAVVVNAANKAYFLRENDPIFNGYVVKITPDSVQFRETVQDKLGHLNTREVVKKIFVPAV